MPNRKVKGWIFTVFVFGKHWFVFSVTLITVMPQFQLPVHYRLATVDGPAGSHAGCLSRNLALSISSGKIKWVIIDIFGWELMMEVCHSGDEALSPFA